MTLDTPIKCKDVTLKLSGNKEQLIQLIFNDLVANTTLILPHKLTVSGRDPVPLQILSQIISRCENLRITYEEADTIIIYHLIVPAPTKAIIFADDTNIFVLL